ncbi:hypothetical protein ACFWVT_20110 [Streptomyces cyaneofuscatus]|uniref:hypothetical protein n=1 Tax=Streptomyces cyaneofuscatus TaxID=66883 RepID=UPI00364CC417
MAVWRVRDFVAEDLEGVVRLDGESRTSEQPAVFRLSEVVAALQGRNPGVVAVAGGHLVGAAVGRQLTSGVGRLTDFAGSWGAR